MADDLCAEKTIYKLDGSYEDQIAALKRLIGLRSDQSLDEYIKPGTDKK